MRGLLSGSCKCVAFGTRVSVDRWRRSCGLLLRNPARPLSIRNSRSVTCSAIHRPPQPVDLEDVHHRACEAGSNTYSDPETGYTVFTARAHLLRGNCCGAPKPGHERKWTCRHCPYEHDGSLGFAASCLLRHYKGTQDSQAAPTEVVRVEPAQTEESISEKEQLAFNMQELDDELSNRHIWLDPGGYFLIRIVPAEECIQVTHVECTVSGETGLVVDESGDAIAPDAVQVAQAPKVYTGRTAKELCVKLFEGVDEAPIQQVSHAAYLGRELVRAELCLKAGQRYIQD